MNSLDLEKSLMSAGFKSVSFDERTIKPLTPKSRSGSITRARSTPARARRVITLRASPALTNDDGSFLVLAKLDELGVAHGHHHVFNGDSVVDAVDIEMDVGVTEATSVELRPAE